MPDCLEKLLKAKPPSGSRNRSELQIACWARSAGKSETDATVLLARWIRHNRQELSPTQAHRRAGGIVHAAWVGNYGFSCAASRAALRDGGLSSDCGACKDVCYKHPQLVSSVRVSESGFLPESRISLEEARELTRALALEACA